MPTDNGINAHVNACKNQAILKKTDLPECSCGPYLNVTYLPFEWPDASQNSLISMFTTQF